MNIALAKAANGLYDAAPALYRLLYGQYKAWSDRSERAVARRLLKPGMTVLDIGANIGIYSAFFAELVGPKGKVVAFEPEQRNVGRLQTAVRNLAQVQVVHAAVGERSGTIKLFVSDDLNVDHHTYASDDGRQSVEVPCIALDDFIGDEPIDLLKMDVQGAEAAALRGASRTLGSLRPALLMEYWPYGLRRAGEDPLTVLRFLSDIGYSWTTVSGERLPPPDCADPNQYVNLIASQSGTV